MKIERLAYFFGNRVVIGSHIKRQLEFLKEKAPPGFKYRQMDDLGCGDGSQSWGKICPRHDQLDKRAFHLYRQPAYQGEL